MLSLPDYPVRQRDYLLEISRAITARLDLGEVLRRVLRASVVMTAARVGLIALHNDETQQFSVQAYTGIKPEHVGLINEKLREIMATFSEKGFEYHTLNDKLTDMVESIDEGLQQAIAMPLIFDKNPLGLLIIFRSYKADVSQNDMQMLHSFADQAAIAVHNAQLYERISEERQRLSAILEHSGDGVMILDPSLYILQINRAFEHMTGWNATTAIGNHQDDVIVWDQIEHDDLQAALDSGWPLATGDDQAADTLYVEGDLKRRDGMTLSIGITYAPLFAADGHLTNIIANVRDITNFRRAQQMQNIFISMVSHELRTPVALIKGYANTLLRPDARWEAETIATSLTVIEEEADRLTVLIDDLLTASKIQSERNVNVTLSDVQLDELARSVVERHTTQTQRHQFALSFPEDFPLAAGDERLLRQVLDNLLTNAIKYSPDGGMITIGGRYNQHSVTIFVRDTGAGIAEDDLEHVFDRFYRADTKLATRTKGTGLGLYLVKAIIEAHDGKIHVKSQLGHGSTFYFTIPRQ